MPAFAHGQTVDWEGITIAGRGVEGDLEWSVGGSRSGQAGATSHVATSLAACSGLEIVAEAGLTRIELTASGTRGGHGDDAAIVIDLGRRADGRQSVVLVEEDGEFTWALPARGTAVVELPIEALRGTRGLLDPVRRIIRVIAVQTVGRVVEHATRTLVGGWDERRHPHRLRTWTPDDHLSPDAGEPALSAMTGGPALLIVHGFTSSIHGSFTFGTDFVRALHGAYGGRTFGFDHPTLAKDPKQNAEWFVDRVRALNPPKGLQLDILAHSRGGLVAREIARALRGSPVGVRSIVFVATPNDGTPLADPDRPKGLLEALTSVAANLPAGDVVELVGELVQDIVLDHAIGALDGLVAMQPHGRYLTALNAEPVDPSITVRAIGADYEPRSDTGIVRTARNLMIDRYFGGARNDLIVPSISTYVTAGRFGIPATDRLLLDASRSVDHATFWTNDRALRQLQEWLRPDWPDRRPLPVPIDECDVLAEVAKPPDPTTIGDLVETVKGLPQAARNAIDQILGGALNLGAKAPTGQRPAVVFLPGIMGSHLRAKVDGSLIWIDPLRLTRGQFRRLSLASPSEEIQPAGINRTYLPLVTELAVDWDVYVADFDWRLDIRASAQRLADLLEQHVLHGDREVHLVAHSMGGLVARALAVVAPDVWAALAEGSRGSGSGRLVMLATPNRGSFAIPLTLLGGELMVRMLAAVDLRSAEDELLRVVTTFPGIYQMLPAPFAKPGDDDHGQLFTRDTWGAASSVRQDLLDQALELHDALREVRDPERLAYVAGYGQPTPFRLEVKSPGNFSIGRFSRGDGRVALDLGVLPELARSTFYVAASHGGVPSHPAVLRAVGDLLRTGTTTELETAEPSRRGEDGIERPAMIPAAEWDPLPLGTRSRGGSDMLVVGWRDAETELNRALRLSIGGGEVQRSRRTVSVRVVHGSLEQATYPVAVGHYSGLPAGGAEAYLDRKLGGVLSIRQRLGLYPEEAGTAIHLPARPDVRPHGALVLGLGEFGTLTRGTLRAAMARGVAALALDASHGDRLAADRSIGVSAVIVGSPGRHGLGIEGSIVALAEGVLQAMAQLGAPAEGVLDSIDLELIELYQEQAEESTEIVCRLAALIEPGLLRDVDLVAAARVESRSGRQPGAAPREEPGSVWVRVLAQLDPPSSPQDGHAEPAAQGLRTMRLTALARTAQANELAHLVDLDKLKDYIDRAVKRPDWSMAAGRTIYQLLFPHRTKLELDRSENLHLILDPETGQIPWELLATREAAGTVNALALRVGMLRQLSDTRPSRERATRPTGLAALVIGDPPTQFSRLPGARNEAKSVAALLRSSGWTVTEQVYESDARPEDDHWMAMQDALLEEPYRAVHIAAHGIFDPAQSERSGVVIGPALHHRLSALDFQQMTVTPDLVFLNCCHLGRLGTSFDEMDEASRSMVTQPSLLASTVAGQLLHNGVGAVIVAGWAVDDLAALSFSTTLYTELLDGRPLGDAVLRARQTARAADPRGGATWGAYQCYGDPNFQLVAQLPTNGRPRAAPVSAAQLARRLDDAAARARQATSADECARIRAEIDRLRAGGSDLLHDETALEALGGAYAEIGAYEEGVAAYTACLQGRGGAGRLRVIEQLANLEVRLATRVAREQRRSTARASALYVHALQLLDGLAALAGPSPERSAIRGSLYKKRAAVGTNRVADLTAARDAYHDAWKASSAQAARLDPYHTNVWLQMAALARSSSRIPADQRQLLARLAQEVDGSANGPTALETRAADDNQGYWRSVAHGDTLVTEAVLGRVSTPLEEAAEAYESAFRLSSTVRERDSSLDHLQDLIDLVPHLADPLTRLRDQLLTFDRSAPP